IIIIIYSIALLMIFIYSLSQLYLLFSYMKARKDKDSAIIFNLPVESNTPYVTIQLPVYNEKYVMERLLRCIAAMDYPRSKLEIQVLDDSTDDSVSDTVLLINELQETGLDIQHIRRTKRVDFKAGALKEGLYTAKGEFI